MAGWSYLDPCPQTPHSRLTCPWTQGTRCIISPRRCRQNSIYFDSATLVGHQICSCRLLVLHAMPQRHSSASAFLLPQGTTPPFSPADLSRVVALISCACTKQRLSEHSTKHLGRWVSAPAPGLIRISILTMVSLSRCFVIHSSSKGHKNPSAPGGGTWHSLHCGATTYCTQGLYAHAPRDSH